jgi:hypothetical protein
VVSSSEVAKDPSRDDDVAAVGSLEKDLWRSPLPSASTTEAGEEEPRARSEL